MLKTYLKEIYDIANRGDDREESYYSVLAGLIKNYAESIGRKNIHVTIAPKKTSAGNPDFRVWDGKQHIVGYIEAKALTNERLELVEDTEQLERYRNTLLAGLDFPPSCCQLATWLYRYLGTTKHRRKKLQALC